MGNVRS